MLWEARTRMKRKKIAVVLNYMLCTVICLCKLCAWIILINFFLSIKQLKENFFFFFYSDLLSASLPSGPNYPPYDSTYKSMDCFSSSWLSFKYFKPDIFFFLQFACIRATTSLFIQLHVIWNHCLLDLIACLFTQQHGIQS